MNKRGNTILRVLINHYHPGTHDHLLQFLPREEAHAIMALNVHSDNLTPLLQQSRLTLEAIHYSWIQPLLNQFSTHLRPAVVAILTETQIAGLRIPPASICEIAKTFMRIQLARLLNIKEHLPVAYLPQTELASLVKQPKAQLVHLIDLLSLHDLAPEARRIVNPNYLKNIYTCLTPKQFHYLKICLHRKEPIIAPKLGLDPAKIESAQLRQTLHRRGLVRLGRALSGQHPDLIWHIAHILDRGRGVLLLQAHRPHESSAITSILEQQVLQAMHFLNHE